MATAIQFLEENLDLAGDPDALMSDNGREFVHRITGLINGFQKLLQEHGIKHICTKVNSPATNGKIERFWRTLKEEVLEKEWFESLEEAQAAIDRYVNYYNYHRLNKAINYNTPASRYYGVSFTDKGFENIPELEHLQDWLHELLPHVG